jgi:hypothetical protein
MQVAALVVILPVLVPLSSFLKDHDKGPFPVEGLLLPSLAGMASYSTHYRAARIRSRDY